MEMSLVDAVIMVEEISPVDKNQLLTLLNVFYETFTVLNTLHIYSVIFIIALKKRYYYINICR